MKLSTTTHTPVLAPPPLPVNAGRSYTVAWVIIILYSLAAIAIIAGGVTESEELHFGALALGLVGGFVQIVVMGKVPKTAIENAKQTTENTLNWKLNDLYPYLKLVYGIDASGPIGVDGITSATKDGEPISVRIEGVAFYENSHFGSPGTGHMDIYNYTYAEVDYSKLGVSIHNPATFTPLEKLA